MRSRRGGYVGTRRSHHPARLRVQPGTWVTLYSGHMGNTFWSRAVPDQGLHGDRTESLDMAIQYAQGHRSKVDTPMPFIDGIEPDGFPGKHLGEVDKLSVPLHLAAAAYTAHAEARRILRFAQAGGIGSRRGLVEFARRALGESRVGAFAVVFIQESVERGLLRAQARPRGHRRILLERPMQPIMPD